MLYPSYEVLSARSRDTKTVVPSPSSVGDAAVRLRESFTIWTPVLTSVYAFVFGR